MSIKNELWLRVQNGDQQAFAELYRSLYRQLYNYGRKFTSQDDILEDALQDSLLSIWNKRNALGSIQHPTTYLFSSFRYILLSRVKAKTHLTLPSDNEGEPEFAADQLIIQKEVDAAKQAQLTEALAALTSRQREAIFLRFYQGMPYEQVAETLGITVKATYKTVARALQELRQLLNELGTVILLLLTTSHPCKLF